MEVRGAKPAVRPINLLGEETVDILLVGLSHKTAPIEIRERLAFSPEMTRSALTHFGPIHSQAHLANVLEGVILSTCNRLEVYALVQKPDIAQAAIIDFLSQSCDIAPQEFSDHLYIYKNEKAVRHLMRVAAGLDSMVLGEPQILGQIAEAYELALSQGAASTVLSALLRAAIHAGKRVRTETNIGISSISISSVAANMVGQLFGNLARRKVLLIGAGEMGAIAIRALIKRGVSQITVANRTFHKAAELAKAWEGEAVNFQQLPAALAQADIVISSTSAPHTILNTALLEPIMANRPDRPMFIMDIAVPRDVDPAVAHIANLHLRDIDDLQIEANQNIHEREAEIPHVEVIVGEEVEQFIEWFSSLEAKSTISALRQRVEDLRQQELQRILNRLDLDERERNLVATMSHRLVNKILHEPTLCLKKETANGNGAAYIATVRQLFSLDNVSAK